MIIWNTFLEGFFNFGSKPQTFTFIVDHYYNQMHSCLKEREGERGRREEGEGRGEGGGKRERGREVE